MKKTFSLLVFLSVLLLCIQIVYSLPPLPTEFYGNATFFNNPVELGQIVSADYAVNQSCGSFSVRNQGHFGLMSCLGDDPGTAVVDGATSGQNLSFYIDDQKASVYGDGTWTSDSFKNLELVVPQVVCGDNFCDDKETCSSCSEDCGSCPSGGSNPTGNGTTTGGGGSTGGGSGSSGSGGSGAGGTSSIGNIPTGGVTGGMTGQQTGGTISSCTEDWVCGNWTECPPSEIQSRNCTDRNYCGTFNSKPVEKKACVYQEENPPKKPSGEGQTKPQQQRPQIITYPEIKCEKEINPLKNGSIWVFLAIFLIIMIRLVALIRKVSKLKEHDFEDKVERAKLIYSAKRKAYIFIGVMIFFAILLYLSYVIFFLCQVNFTALLSILAAIVIMPFIIHQIIHYFEYHEHEKIRKLENLENVHMEHLQKLIALENRNIQELLGDVKRNSKFDISDDKLTIAVANYEKLKILRRELPEIIQKYESDSMSEGEERDFVDLIYSMLNDPEFKKLMEQFSKVDMLGQTLDLLYKHYEQKQELYDEIASEESGEEVEDEKENDEAPETLDKEQGEGKEEEEDGEESGDGTENPDDNTVKQNPENNEQDKEKEGPDTPQEKQEEQDASGDNSTEENGADKNVQVTPQTEDPQQTPTSEKTGSEPGSQEQPVSENSSEKEVTNPEDFGTGKETEDEQNKKTNIS